MCIPSIVVRLYDQAGKDKSEAALLQTTLQTVVSSADESRTSAEQSMKRSELLMQQLTERDEKELQKIENLSAELQVEQRRRLELKVRCTQCCFYVRKNVLGSSIVLRHAF